MNDGFSISRIPRLLYGPGSLAAILNELAARGETDIALVSGSTWFPGSVFESAIGNVCADRGRLRTYRCEGEPSPRVVDEIACDLRPDPPDLILAVGGGSVLDTGKAVSAMIPACDSVRRYLDGIGTKPAPDSRVKIIAVPTTAGTGSEATKNAVISEIGVGGFKKSLRHDAYVPDVAVLDPDLSVGCPPAVTAASGLDATTQLLEAYVSSESNRFTDSLCVDGLRLAGRYLNEVVAEPANKSARGGMLYAAYLSGIGLANAGLGIVHGLASPVGALRPIPHGVVCARLLPAAVRVATDLLRSESNDKTPAVKTALRKYGDAGFYLSGDCPGYAENSGGSDDGVSLLIDVLEKWIARFEIPSLSAYGFTRADLDAVTEDASAKNTPVAITRDAIRKILNEASSV